MCFRPSIIDNRNNAIRECPTCGMPVEANADVTSGTCPYCGSVIPEDSPAEQSSSDPHNNFRIL